MARIEPLTYDSADEARRAAYDETERTIGRMTNMKRTLLHSLPAFHALMEWYPLRDTVKPFLGERRTNLFAHAISTQSDCLICSTYFRRILIDAGENPDQLELDEQDRAVIAFGRQLTTDRNRVEDALYKQLAAFYTPEQIVALTAFGALMVATNIVNNVLDVPLDDYLVPYVRQPAEAA
jgi:alkylhydroperoxidase family enzyme